MFVSVVASAAILGPVVALAAPSSSIKAHQDHRRLAPDNADVIIQMFEWNWNSVASECTSFIGPAGYKYVQVSPASEHIQGDQWWTSYQKVSNTIQSKRGSRQEFQDMVSTCKAAGVSVLVDTIFNHMAGIDSGTGVAGTSFTHYTYNGIYSTYDFHYCGTDGDDIQDWSNKTQIQFCELSNLADLKTESDYVRSTLIDHGNDLLSLGVAGFRLDAAKHVPTSDLQVILSSLSSTPYITSEVIGNGPPIPESDYTSIGSVSTFESYEYLQKSFEGTDGYSLQSLNGWESVTGIDSSAATVFVATHDQERGGDCLSYTSANNMYTLAHVFMLAYSYGTPTVLSSFSFSNSDDGAPNGGTGTCTGNTGENGWLCQHRWMAVSNMVPFRKAASGTSVENWQSGSSAQIAFSRGDAGFVVINNDGSTWSNTFTTGLADGTYCDIVAGSVSGESCTGTTVSVSGGKATVDVPSHWAIAIYNGAKL